MPRDRDSIRITVHDGRPVVHQVLPDPRAWRGRESERPAGLVRQGHFDAFDTAVRLGLWKSGSWTASDVKRANAAKEVATEEVTSETTMSG